MEFSPLNRHHFDQFDDFGRNDKNVGINGGFLQHADYVTLSDNDLLQLGYLSPYSSTITKFWSSISRK